MGAKASRPVRIAHGFGNSRRCLARALQAPVDLIEADVWFQDGGIAVRHERRLGPLPILFDRQRRYDGGPGPGRFGLSLGRWYVKLETSPFSLEELMAKARGKRGLLLDLKGRYGHKEPAFAGTLAELVARMDMDDDVAICGQNWRLLKQVRRQAPHLAVHYSINSAAQLATFQRMLEGDPLHRICLRQSLIDAALARSLKSLGMTIYTWTVDDLQRAHELLELGVDGIISDSLEVLGLLRRPQQRRV